jgi:hypothetical protein
MRIGVSEIIAHTSPSRLAENRRQHHAATAEVPDRQRGGSRTSLGWCRRNVRPPSSRVTSRCRAVTDTLFGALGALAAGEGTMNNLNFGNTRYQYDETICSGSPAGPGFPGHRCGAYPNDEHAAQRSGGAGAPLSRAAGRFPRPHRLWRARQVERRRRHPPHHTIPRTMECTILSGNRRVPPFGLAGGGPGRSARTGCAARTGAWSGCRMRRHHAGSSRGTHPEPHRGWLRQA